MVNIKYFGNLYFVQTKNADGVITASATYEVLSYSLYCEFINELINKEISDIREFEHIENLTNQEILQEFQDNFEELFFLKNTVSQNSSIVYLKSIENKGIEKGAAKEIVDYLKSNYDKIILYSLEDAIDYWINSNFKSVYRDEYYGFNFKN